MKTIFQLLLLCNIFLVLPSCKHKDQSLKIQNTIINLVRDSTPHCIFVKISSDNNLIPDYYLSVDSSGKKFIWEAKENTIRNVTDSIVREATY